MPGPEPARTSAGARSVRRFGWLLALALVGSATAQGRALQLDDVFEADFYRPTAFLDERDRVITERLAAADRARAEEDWRALVEALQDVLSIDGHQNAPWGPRTYRDARLEARGRLLRVPAPAREIYDHLFGPRANAQLAEAGGERRPDVWRRVAALHPLSEAAETSLRRLALLTFEAGAHREAAYWSERLEEVRRARGQPLDPDAAARWLVSLAELGAGSSIARLTERWQEAMPDAIVSIGDREVPLETFVEDLSIEPDGFDHRPPAFSASEVELAWSQALPKAESDEQPTPVGVVVGSVLYVHSAAGLSALDVGTGEPVWQVSAGAFQPRPPGRDTALHRESLTADVGIAADEERVYLVRSGREGYRDVLLCLSAEDGRLLWRRGDVGDELLSRARLCRSPAVDAGTLYLSVTVETSPLESRLLALDAESGEVEWNRFLAAGRPLVSGDRFNTAVAPAVTPGDPHIGEKGIYVLTNLGVIACIDPMEERVRWIFHYSRVRDDRSLPPEKIGYFEVEAWQRGALVLGSEDLLATPADSEWAYALSHVPDPDGHLLRAEPLFKAPRSLRELIGSGEGILLFEQVWEQRSRIAAYGPRFELRWVSMPITARERLVGRPLVTQEQVIYATGRRLYFLELDRDGALVQMQAAPELALENAAASRERFERFLIGGGLLITLSRSGVLAWAPK